MQVNRAYIKSGKSKAAKPENLKKSGFEISSCIILYFLMYKSIRV